MKALVYHGPGKRAWEEKARPRIQDAGDAIVRITTTTICGTDLHILKGDVPTVTRGADSGPRGRRRRGGAGRRRGRPEQGRQGPDLVHHVLRHVRLLQEGHVLALPDGRVDPRPL